MDLTGNWDYFFLAVSTDSCTVPELQQGCSGGGRFEIEQSGDAFQVNGTENAGCQTCGMAWDYRGPTPVSSKFSGTNLELTLNECQFTAALPGEVQGQFDGLGLRGNDSTPVIAEDVVVPEESRLGEDGDGLAIMLETVPTLFNVMTAACAPV